MSVITGDDDGEVVRAANVAVSAIVECVTHKSGTMCHVFLDDSNQCQCGDKELDDYRRIGLPR